MSYGSFNPDMLTVAREARGLTQAALVRSLLDAGEKLQQGALSKIESGQTTPPHGLFKAIQRCLRFPESFFFQPDIAYPFGSSTFYHRKQQSLPSTTLRKIQAKINIYRFQIARLLKATDLDKRNRFRHINPKEHPNKIREIAQLVRATWRLPDGPIPNLIRVIEDVGGIVVRFDFETNQLSGISEWIPPVPPLFFLNDRNDLSGDRDRFTLAHELGHVIMHDLPSPAMEDEANEFAGEFLMPASEFRSHLRLPLRLEALVEMKRYWKTSMASMIENAYQLQAINDRQRQYLHIQLASRGYCTREPVEIARERPTLLNEIIRAHICELGYTTESLAQMLNTTVEEFRTLYPSDEPKLVLVKS